MRAHVLGRYVERHLGEEEVGADARGGADMVTLLDGVHEAPRKGLGAEAIALEVGGCVDEALVDGVRMNV